MTAEEFLGDALQPMIAIDDLSYTSIEDMKKQPEWDVVKKALIDFAKLKGKEILKAASENAEVHYPICNNYNASVDKDSILNAYDLNQIK